MNTIFFTPQIALLWDAVLGARSTEPGVYF